MRKALILVILLTLVSDLGFAQVRGMKRQSKMKPAVEQAASRY